MTNEMGDDYYHTMDRDYKQRVHQSMAGPHVFEDVEGKFTTSLPKWIRTGTESIELQLGQGKAGEMGPESYGKDAREELKKLAELSGVNVHTVHAPVTVQGLSGFDPRNGRFAEGRSDLLVNELNKTIDFAADTTKGSNIVFHLGEFPRSMNELDPKFEMYEGEEKNADIWFGDTISGNAQRIKRDIEISAPVRKENGEFEIENGRKKIDEINWNDLNKQLSELKHKSPEEGIDKFKRMHCMADDKMKGAVEKWQNDLPTLALLTEFYQRKIDDLNAQENKVESDFLEARRRLDLAKRRGDREEIELYQNHINEMENNRQDILADFESKKIKLEREKWSVTPLKDLALPRSADAIAKAAVNAYDRVQEKHLARPITLVPENLGPQEYGSHPDEMIEIVNKSREAFVRRLTEKKMEEPSGLTDKKGKPIIIDNPYFRKEFGENLGKAKELAKQYIKSTIDAQHLQMWQAHFKREQGETELQREKRFYTWYDEQLRKLMKEDVLGHVHVVDGMGRGHVHLPVGQGRIMEMSEAFDELRSMGLSMTHEGWMEGQARHLSGTWEASGQKIYGSPGGDYVLSERYHEHLGTEQPPGYFTPDETDFSSHPEDFKIWSEVPLE